MSSHSEEIWESFDALWRRLQQLGKQVTELEARLGAIEIAGPPGSDDGVRTEQAGRSISLYEGEIRR